MSATNTTGSADEFERDTDTAEAESIHAEQQSDTKNINTPRLSLDAIPLASLGVAVAVGILLQNPDLRKAVRSVVQDPEVQKVCREAGDMVFREIAASWRRHGGMTVLAGTFLR